MTCGEESGECSEGSLGADSGILDNGAALTEADGAVEASGFSFGKILLIQNPPPPPQPCGLCFCETMASSFSWALSAAGQQPALQPWLPLGETNEALRAQSLRRLLVFRLPVYLHDSP